MKIKPFNPAPNEAVINGRCSYLNVLEARQVNGKGDAQFSVAMLIDKNDAESLAVIKKAMEQARANGVTEGKKPFNQMSPARLAEMNLTWKDGDSAKYEDQPECKGCWILGAKSPGDKPVGVLNEKKEKVVKGSENETQIYSGMMASFHVQLFPYDSMGNQGIGCSLQNVMKTGDADPLGGSRKKAEDVFGAPESPFDAPVTAGAAVAAGGPPM